MKRFLSILGILACWLVSAGSAQAILLSDLLNGGSITADDKLFDQWRVIDQFSSDGHIVNTANIDVLPLNDGGMDPGPGLQFDISNGEFNVTGDDIYAYLDFMFGFRVSVLDPGLWIKDNTLFLGPGQLENSTTDVGIFIMEQVGTDPGLVESRSGDLADLAVKQVEHSFLEGQGLTSNLIDSAAFTPQKEIFVSKNILVWATDPAETASLGGFTQRFSQVPEPAILALLGGGLIGLHVNRRKRVN